MTTWEPLLEGPERFNDSNEGHLTVKNGELYWKNQKVKAEASLSRLQKLAAWMVGGIAVVGSIASLINSVVSVNKEFCFVSSISCISSHPSSTSEVPSNKKTD